MLNKANFVHVTSEDEKKADLLNPNCISSRFKPCSPIPDKSWRQSFDQLLELDSQANLDSRRMKRARLIKKINQHYLAQTGRVLIIQDKMSDDKRYVTYLIQG